MRNPYQLTGYTAKGNGTLLGTFDTQRSRGGSESKTN